MLILATKTVTHRIMVTKEVTAKITAARIMVTTQQQPFVITCKKVYANFYMLI